MGALPKPAYSRNFVIAVVSVAILVTAVFGAVFGYILAIVYGTSHLETILAVTAVTVGIVLLFMWVLLFRVATGTQGKP